jgi:hypothetical protein
MSPDKIEFPDWMPPDAQRECTNFYSIAQNASYSEGLEVLQRLATRDEMKEAWEELKHFADVSPSDLMASTFFVWFLATRNRLLRKFPHFKSNDDRELASMIRVAIRVITVALLDPAIRAEINITDTTLRELERAAAIYERKAKNSDVLLNIAAPPTKAGARTADQTAFVYAMCDWLGRKTGLRRPYILVAILANVAFDGSENQWDADRVKKCLGSRFPKK